MLNDTQQHTFHYNFDKFKIVICFFLLRKGLKVYRNTGNKVDDAQKAGSGQYTVQYTHYNT